MGPVQSLVIAKGIGVCHCLESASAYVAKAKETLLWLRCLAAERLLELVRESRVDEPLVPAHVQRAG